MRFARLDLALQNVCYEKCVVLDGDSLAHATGGRGQGAVQKQIPFWTRIQLQRGTLVSIPAGDRSAGERDLLLRLVQDNQTELTDLFQERVCVSSFQDGHPK